MSLSKSAGLAGSLFVAATSAIARTRSLSITTTRRIRIAYSYDMTAYICLLRGVNVGGNKMLKMAELKALFDALHLRDAKTYLQSGNVVFASDETDRAVLKNRIE